MNTDKVKMPKDFNESIRMRKSKEQMKAAEESQREQAMTLRENSSTCS
jgi:hypothetical protein